MRPWRSPHGGYEWIPITPHSARLPDVLGLIRE
jgi:hypothetical protein